MKIKRKSTLTGIEHELDLDVTKEQMNRFNLSASDREFILSGITDEEWKEAFGEDD